ncbi:hypothetical protein BAUCODRAFT_99611 [Baudoinia panamericana UAMH 10762]|uniref:Uncharacterized protein n=1 Tax=Baudoinia panamericana (strain UAMH 10762) TaxID=717646 RepID=M2N8D3_BAUPA|nr:uncharacterized protein BAUCODRAFT_99611 [Baudoinia panamericana UAMH 10762]EMD00404.1 hypothetical protein BAUCODRAFT_99611 [Baudoinia panamericana UAMH 10762]
MAAATLFAPIAKQRVSPTNPARDGKDLDVERCAALHNTLMLYGWVCSGRKVKELVKRSWWSNHGSQSLQQILKPSLIRYLSKIFEVPSHRFFYHLSGLARPREMLQLGDVLEDQDRDTGKDNKYRFVVLYTTPKALVTFPAGLVFDQETNRAILMPTYHHLFDMTDPHLPWQKLETILSAFIDMIEADKAIASAAQLSSTHPWILQPYTHDDLRLSLDAWKRLVLAIEKRANVIRPDDLAPLGTNSLLSTAGVPRGFAHELLLRALPSEVWFVAPGIRLPKIEEFLHQPFREILQQYPKETAGTKMPFLFLRCPGTVSAKEAKFRWPYSTVESVPCGLYLDAFPNAQNPFEDACRLVLPIRLGGNRYARTSDFHPIRTSYCDLYQVDINPFVMRHGPKLVGILESWLENVENGHWSVNEKGVEGGIGVWRKADTREDWWRYQSKRIY